MCHTELHFESGLLKLGVAPITMGHEMAGVIDQVGEGVDPSRLGQRVLVYYYAGCGECEWCRRGEENLCGSLKAEYGFFGDVAVVYGVGTVGYGLIQVARLRGARVIAVAGPRRSWLWPGSWQKGARGGADLNKTAVD